MKNEPNYGLTPLFRCEIDPLNASASLTLATWQAWFGPDSDYEATRRRLVQQAEGTDQASTAASAAQAFCLRPSTNAGLQTKVLNLAQRAVELGKTDSAMPWYRLALGLAEYRNGQFAAAERSLATLTMADKAVSRVHEPVLPVIAGLFRAMSLFRQDNLEEARGTFGLAQAQMPPLPKADRKPIVNGEMLNADFPTCWMAYSEARRLLDESKPAKP